MTNSCKSLERNGAPERIRTSDPQIRRQARFDVSAADFCKIAGNADKSNQCVREGFANRQTAIQTASLWLHQHRDTLTRPVIPTLRERFGLTIIEAIEAGKLAHRLAYGGTHG